MYWVRHFLATVCLVLVLGSCDEDAPSQSAFPDTLNTEREACESTGGRWGAAANKGSFVCYRTLPDANKSCTNSNQCRGSCLARSRTCTPVTPFYGCNEVLNASGLPQTVCVE